MLRGRCCLRSDFLALRGSRSSTHLDRTPSRKTAVADSLFTTPLATVPQSLVHLTGEVFVLDDGGEADLDLGNYERYLDITLSKDNNITTGKIYKEVIEKEVRP